MANDAIYEFVIKLDIKADGVALPTVNANPKTTGIIKENCLIDGGGKLVAVKIPKLTADPQFVLLTPLPVKTGDPAPNLIYGFSTKDKAKPLAAPQVFFNGSEAWLGATGADGTGVDAINFWADNPVTVQIIIGFNAKPTPKPAA